MYSYRALTETFNSLLNKQNIREISLFVLAAFFLNYIIKTGQAEVFIFLSLVGISFVFLVTMPLDRCIMLVSILAVFNYTYTFFSGVSPEAEPMQLKLLKDLLVLVLLTNYFSKTLISGRIKRVKSIVAIPIAVFVAYIIFLFFFTFDRAGLPLIFLRYFVAYPLLILVIARGLNSINKIKNYFRMFFKVSLFISVLAIFQALFNLGNNFYGYYSNVFGLVVGRATATLGNPNNLAQFLSIGFIFYWGLRSRQAQKSLGLNGLGRYALLFFLGIFFTFSRSALGALVIVISLAFLIAQKITKRALRSFLIMFSIGAPAFLLYSSFRGGVAALAGDGRIALYLGFAKEMLTSHLEMFLFGFGREISINPELLLGLKISSTTHNPIADSLYVTIFSHSGIIGLILFLLSLIAILKIGFSLARSSKDVFISQAAYSISLLTLFFMIAGIFISNLSLFPSALFFWIFIGILFNLLRIERNMCKKVIS